MATVNAPIIQNPVMLDEIIGEIQTGKQLLLLQIQNVVRVFNQRIADQFAGFQTVVDPRNTRPQVV